MKRIAGLLLDSFKTLPHPSLAIPQPCPDPGPLFGRTLVSGDLHRLQFGVRLEF